MVVRSSSWSPLGKRSGGAQIQVLVIQVMKSQHQTPPPGHHTPQ